MGQRHESKKQGLAKALLSIAAAFCLVLNSGAVLDLGTEGSITEDTQKTSGALTQVVEKDPSQLVDVIVMYVEPVKSSDLNTVISSGGLVKEDFTEISALSVTTTALAADQLSTDPSVEYVAINAEIGALLEVARPTNEADEEFSRNRDYGFTGKGITIAVIDSGVAPHPDLGDRLVASYDARDGVVATAPADPLGHGTHVAGIIAGDGNSSNGEYRGIAPEANIISLQVLDGSGMGETADAIEAVEWVIRNRNKHNISAINMSLGHPIFEPAAMDPLVRVVERAVSVGVTVICSAGNYGTYGYGGFFSISSPGNARDVITVGSLTDWNTYGTGDDTVSSYSSKGPTLVDLNLKPDLVATGNRIISLRSEGSTLDVQYPENQRTGKGNRVAYYEMSGTSMAAPMVAGAVALMLEKDPSLNPATLKARLMASANREVDENPLARGAGGLQVLSALDATGFATRAPSPSLFQGLECCGIFISEDLKQLWGDEQWNQGVLWGEGTLWGEGALWADGALWGESTLWGEGILWGEGYLNGDSTLWGEGILWGEMFPEAD